MVGLPGSVCGDEMETIKMKRGLGLWIILLLAVYAAGLTCDLSEPWVGMHDWNGAFFSQLARNHLRHPASIHHGLPIVAAGAGTPPPEDRSIYATHPPGLVWLLAGLFRLCGESEAVARMLPIGSSLVSLGLLVWLVSRAYDPRIAITAGTIYAVMPMSVYFGRMVDHEAVCLMSMLGMAAAWSMLRSARISPATRAAAAGAWGGLLLLGAWVDWPVILFSGLLCLSAVRAYRSESISSRLFATVLGWTALAIVCMLTYVVYFGLEGRWGDWIAILTSRSIEPDGGVLRRDGASPGGPLRYTIENLSWPLVMLALVGTATTARRWYSSRNNRSESSPERGNTPLPRVGAEGNDTDGSIAARQGLSLILWTGLIWVAVFWRQYERHNYWLFYLGPAATVLAARGLFVLWNRLRRISAKMAYGIAGGLLIATLFVEILGTRDYFIRVAYPPAEVEDWRRIRDMTAEGDGVLLFRNPFRIEIRGKYRFRNMVPPHIPYYLDRRIAFERDFEAVVRQADEFAVFVMPSRDAAHYQESWRDVLGGFPRMSLEGKVVFDLRGEQPDRPMGVQSLK